VPRGCLGWEGSEVFAGQGLTDGADRVELVVLGAVASGRTCGSVDFDDPFAAFEQEGRQSGAEATAAFDGPHASRGSVPDADVEAASVSHGGPPSCGTTIVSPASRRVR